MIYGRSESQFPDMEYILGIADTAYTEKQENDYSAFVVLGVWRNLYGQPQVMLMHAWQKRLRLHDCVELLIKSAEKLKCDRVLVENKASGISIFQEIVRLTRDESFAIQLINPRRQAGDGDDDDAKTARANAVSHFWGEERDDGRRPGIIWAPAVTQPDGEIWPRAWADLVMAQAAEFPKGKTDDLVDALIHGMRFLRQRGLVKRTREVELEEIAELRDPGSAPAPLYPS
jgi:phage terminase large subunit-like protein